MDHQRGALRARRIRAVSAAYRRHWCLVYHLALRYGGGRVAFAEDVTQEVFIQLLRHADALRALEQLEGWLYRVTTRRCLTKLRNERVAGLLNLQWLRQHKASQTADDAGGARATSFSGPLMR